MEIVIYCIAVVILYYCIHIGLLIYGVSKVAVFEFKLSQVSPLVEFTLVIPFKNEEANLESLLNSISQLNYDKLSYEVILVNDSSTDLSTQIINSWRFKNPYVQLTILDNVVVSKSSKKDAITRAISIAKHNWILTSDADCILPIELLNCYSEFLVANSTKKFIIGGVSISNHNQFVSIYQVLDILSLQAVTIGSFGIDEAFMCNGANLAFTKQIFNSVNGYTDVNYIASGDDVFLLQKVLQYNPQSVGYLLSSDSVVKTKPVSTWKQVIIQRARWGKKAIAYKTLYPKILGVVSILANFCLIVLFLGLFIDGYLAVCAALILLKFCFDIVFLSYASRCINKQLLIYFPLSFVIYPFLMILISLRMVFSSNNWIK